MAKGVPPGQAHDIDIPPPRPKRKPSSPYPRKCSTLSSLSSTGEVVNEKSTNYSLSLLSANNREVLQEESDAPSELQIKEMSENGSCSEVLNLFQEAPRASMSSVNEGSTNRSAFKGFEPMMKETKERSLMEKTLVLTETNEKPDDGTDQETERLKGFRISFDSNRPKNEGVNDQGSPPVETIQVVDQINNPMAEQVGGAHGESANPTINHSLSTGPKLHEYSTMPSFHPNYPIFSSFPQCHNQQDAYRSFQNISSTFSNLLVSALVQNPAIHTAARFAASFWPSSEINASVGSNPETLASQNFASLATATVAAASAWWTTQGLLPMFPPTPIGFAFAPPATTTVLPMVSRARISEKESGDEIFQGPSKDHEAPNLDQSGGLKKQFPSSKPSPSSSSDSYESGREEEERSPCAELKASRTSQSKPSSANEGTNNDDSLRNNKKQGRSSCGSNAPSSSDVETDMPENNEKINDNSKEAYFGNSSAGDTNHRRFRSSGSTNDSWKEVSEEGRLAFDALFSREILPQSFSPPHAEGKGVQCKEGEETTSPPINNTNSTPDTLFRSNESSELGSLLTSGLLQAKLKARRTGFKPYKRCSVEAKESRATAGEEAISNKRIRLEGETST